MLSFSTSPKTCFPEFFLGLAPIKAYGDQTIYCFIFPTVPTIFPTGLSYHIFHERYEMLARKEMESSDLKAETLSYFQLQKIVRLNLSPFK